MKLEAMKEFAKDNNIKVSKKDADKPKKIAKLIREMWQEDEVEMECLCPQCDEEIPDIDTCPFCGSVFAGDEEKEEEEKPKKEKASKKKEKKKKAEKKETKSKKKSKAKRGPKAGGLNFKDAVEHLSEYSEEAGLDVRERGSFTSYFIEGTRVFSIAKTTRSYSLQIGVPGFSAKGKGEYREYTDEEKESGHLAKSCGIFKTESLDEVLAAAKSLTKLAKQYNKEKPAAKLSKKKEKKVAKKKVVKKPAKKVKSKKKKKKK